MKEIGNVLWGIVFIVIGIIVGANALGIANINIFFDGWWTLFLIVPCFIGLFKENEKTGNIIGLLLGVALLLGCQDILAFDLIWKLAIPVILVIIGISIIFKDMIGGKVNEEIKKLNKTGDKDNSYCAAFSGQEIKFDKEVFRGANLTAIFGGIECDLRNAIIEEDIIINASSIFGGIDILMPANVKVKTKGTSVFGGVENKTNTVEEENTYTIYINGIAIFGGVDIK